MDSTHAHMFAFPGNLKTWKLKVYNIFADYTNDNNCENSHCEYQFANTTVVLLALCAKWVDPFGIDVVGTPFNITMFNYKYVR